MKNIEIIYGILIVVLGILTSKSDLKEGRIYNKTLVFFGSASVLLGVLYYGYYVRDLMAIFFINYLMVAAVSLMLFYSHSFAGGDCKLVLVMGLLYPANYYMIYGNSVVTLVFALGISILYGYLYLISSAIWGLIRRKNHITRGYVKECFLAFLKSFVSAMVYISAANMLVFGLINYGININIWFVRILCIAIAWIIGKNKCLQKWYIIVGVFILDLIIGYILKVIPFSINPENYTLAIILLLCQMTIKTNLYEEVLVSEIKQGMILSTVSSMLMQNSRVRGLPPVSTEDLRSRLTVSEINSINRWTEGKKITSLVIVKKIPFAVFIFMGFISYFVLWSVVR